MHPVPQQLLDRVEPLQRIGRESHAGENERRQQRPTLGGEVLSTDGAERRGDLRTGRHQVDVQQQQREKIGQARLLVRRLEKKVAKRIDRPRQRLLTGKGRFVEALPSESRHDQETKEEEDGPVMIKHDGCSGSSALVTRYRHRRVARSLAACSLPFLLSLHRAPPDASAGSASSRSYRIVPSRIACLPRRRRRTSENNGSRAGTPRRRGGSRG